MFCYLLRSYNLNEEYINLCILIYESGYSTLDFIEWLKQTTLLSEINKNEVIMYFHKIKSELRNEKLLLFTLFTLMKQTI